MSCHVCGGRLAAIPYSKERRGALANMRCQACGKEQRVPPTPSPASDLLIEIGLGPVLIFLGVYGVLGLEFCASWGWWWLPVVVGLPVVVFRGVAKRR